MGNAGKRMIDMKKIKYLPPDGSTLAERLRAFRVQVGLSQKNVADVLNVSRSTYTYYETGKTTPDPATLNRIAKILNVPLEYFFSSELEGGLPPLLGDRANQRAPKKPKLDPERVGELSSGERAVVAFLRDKSIPAEDALAILEQLTRQRY